jgi:hypothetical protein
MMNAVGLARLLRGYSLRRSREKDLQADVEEVLRLKDVPFVREYCLDVANRVDFWIPDGRVALEIKIKGSLTHVAMQLSRYAKFGEVGEILLLTTRPGHTAVPREMNRKHVVVEVVEGRGL